MARVRWHETKAGERNAYVVWKDDKGGEHSRPLGPVSEDVAEAEAEITAREVERRKARPAAVGGRTALARFLMHWRTIKRARPATLRFYRQKLVPVVAFMGERGPMKSWDRLWLEAYLLAHPKWSPRMVAMTLTSCRTFSKWCRRQRMACPDFVEDLKPPKREHRVRPFYTAVQVRDLLREAKRHRYLEVPIALAVLAGLSLADLRGLTWAEVSLERRLIDRPRSKTGVPILVPIGPTLFDMLKRHRAIAGPVCRGLPKEEGNLYHALGRCMKRARIPLGGWHRLRHTYGTLLMNAGAFLPTIGRLLGHEEGSPVTGIYTHADETIKRAAIEAIDLAVRQA